MKLQQITLREIQMPLAHPFVTSFGRTNTRRILLVQIESDGVSAWGECVAGEHPYFSDEMIDTAWLITESELVPRLLGKTLEKGSDIPALLEQVRGHRMAKAAVENAVWDMEAQVKGVSLARLLGGTRDRIACGVSIGMQDTMDEQLAKVEQEVAAGYQRIKLKCKPGWDTEMFAAVRKRWPDILLSCDANSAYRLSDADHIATWDEFNLLMIEQPLWYDDFFFHAELQRRIKTDICLDECIRNRRDADAALRLGSGRILNIKVGRVGGFSEAIAIHDIAQQHGVPVWCGGMLESGIGRAQNIALSSLPNFTLPGDVSASKRYWAQDIIHPEVTVSPEGEIAVPASPGRGFEVDQDRVDALTVRRAHFNG
ncbi:o-succinylbenzoate synthase [Terriglobus aquaticus]|uniref:o-succinylbenzoate synthase n=1 Tax=Terriglobus aquaticus TaxID=940139 RepID=A0ABW9KK63_9BACT|nr:o-succinylbenzoate synthase [Terriglobus aquaticus]